MDKFRPIIHSISAKNWEAFVKLLYCVPASGLAIIWLAEWDRVICGFNNTVSQAIIRFSARLESIFVFLDTRIKPGTFLISASTFSAFTRGSLVIVGVSRGLGCLLPINFDS